MEKYRCHKIVEAAKILSTPELSHEPWPRPPARCPIGIETPEGGDIVMVEGAWLERHAPKVGGYLVRYDDGYLSFSPAEPFEDGYQAVTPKPGSRHEFFVKRMQELGAYDEDSDYAGSMGRQVEELSAVCERYGNSGQSLTIMMTLWRQLFREWQAAGVEKAERELDALRSSINESVESSPKA